MTDSRHVDSALILDEGHPLRRALGAARMARWVLGLAALLGFFDPAQFFRSYLVTYMFWSGIALGAMAVLMLQYVTGGAWGALIRRVLEAAVRTLPLLAVLFLPLLFGLSSLYEWARPGEVAHDAILQHKSLYLNVPFFVLRAAIYFSAWLTLGHFLTVWSGRQDETGAPAIGHRLETLSRGGLVLYVFTMTFASIDWLMSLEPHWFSTMYGILFAAGQVLSAFAFVIPVVALLADRPPFSIVASADRLHDLGKLLLAFVMIWAYLAFSQFLIIWSANLPEETPWYLHRLTGGWQILGAALILFHFALPFGVLLSRGLKRNARLLATVALGILFLRFLDIFWLVAPAFSPNAFSFHLQDLLILIGVGGVWLSSFLAHLAAHPLLPLHDPSLLLEEEISSGEVSVA